MYKTKRFRIKPWEDLKDEIDAAAVMWPGIRRIFLADGDAFILSTGRLERILDHCRRAFPSLQRVTAYATPQNLLGKSVEEMRRLVSAGLSILYYGVETGDQELLERIGKGASPDEMVEGCLKAREAGFKLSVTVILGLGGREGSRRHARATADLLGRIRPRYLSALTLMLGDFESAFLSGMPTGYTLNGPIDDIRELGELIGGLETDRCIFRSNHASNYLPLKGTLLKDKERLLAEIGRALAEPDLYLRGEWMRGL